METLKKIDYNLVVGYTLTFDKKTGTLHLIDSSRQVGMCEEAKRYPRRDPNMVILQGVYDMFDEYIHPDVRYLYDPNIARLYCALIHGQPFLTHQQPNTYKVCDKCIVDLYEKIPIRER